MNVMWTTLLWTVNLETKMVNYEEEPKKVKKSDWTEVWTDWTLLDFSTRFIEHASRYEEELFYSRTLN